MLLAGFAALLITTVIIMTSIQSSMAEKLGVRIRVNEQGRVESAVRDENVRDTLAEIKADVKEIKAVVKPNSLTRSNP